MSSYRSNAAKFDLELKETKKRPAESAPEGEAPAKRMKIIDLTMDVDEPTQALPPTPAPAALAVPLKRVWKTFMPDQAKPNFRYCEDQPSLQEILEEEQKSWHYSPSLHGYVRSVCAVCSSELSPDEHLGCASYRSQLPFANESVAAGGVGRPLSNFKIRAIQTCSACATRISANLSADPQGYNGRGRTYWVFPAY